MMFGLDSFNLINEFERASNEPNVEQLASSPARLQPYWITNISIIKQLQIKIIILGFRNRFGVSKVSQPPESEFFIMKIKLPMFVVEALPSPFW